MDRRRFIVGSGLALTAAAVGAVPSAATPSIDGWDEVRAQFDLRGDLIHMGGLYIASHPAPVREAIERHRRAMDENPVEYLQQRGGDLEDDVRRAASDYLLADAGSIALTDSTTMGLGLLYNGIDLRDGDDVLTTTHDYYSSHESLRLRAARTGAQLRQVRLYGRDPSVDAIVGALIRSVRPNTRLVALTWVHSSTGVRLPIRPIADALAKLNAEREPGERALLAVDGVHGLGAVDASFVDLDCDFLVAGCHKWLHGPRGTGIIAGKTRAWSRVTPTIPSFGDRRLPGELMTPGGFHSFEHRWALAEAFRFHELLGRARIAVRIHELARQLKEGLATIRGVTIHTPLADELSAGIVCFEIAGVPPRRAVELLRARRIVATVTPYANQYIRLAPGIFNTPDEVDAALAAVRAIA